MEDAETLPAFYSEWFSDAKKVERLYKGRGDIVERIYLDPDTFPEWCRARGLNVDSAARNRFAAEAVAIKYGNQH